MFDAQDICLPRSRALRRAGNSKVIKMAMMEMTTNSSMSVNRADEIPLDTLLDWNVFIDMFLT